MIPAEATHRPWPTTGARAPGATWLLTLLAAAALSLSPARADAADATVGDAADASPAPDFALIEEALEIIGERFVDEEALSAENLTIGAIRGIVEALGDDGHTVYLTPAELAAERDALEGRVSGIGIVVDQRGGSARIISVVDGSPADLAGLRGGDIIVSIDGGDITRVPIGEVADRVRGDVDTTVRLGIERPGLSEPLEVDIVRGTIEIDPASWALVPGSDAAVVRIVQFSSGAGRQTREAIESAMAAGANGIVLDLRGNPGGLVDEAIAVASSFLDGGVAYQEQDRDGELRPVPIRRGRSIAPAIPLVVLVDYGTASSAEILASALRDNGRAPIVGEATFGTGTVLNTFDLSDGSALRIGVLRWLTADGTDVFRVGVIPDHEVELPPGAVALDPGDLVGMTARDLEHSADLPLLFAIDRLDPPAVA